MGKTKNCNFLPFLSSTIQLLLQIWRNFHSPFVQAPLRLVIINRAVMKIKRFLQFTNWFLVCLLNPPQRLQSCRTTSNIQWPSAPPSFIDNLNLLSMSCGIHDWLCMFTPSNVSGKTLSVREHQNEQTVPWQMKSGIKLLSPFMCTVWFYPYFKASNLDNF